MTSGHAVHIVEDDPSTRNLIATIVESLGYRAVCHRDGEAADLAFFTESPSIVVSDWKMPRLDGLELCRRLRERPGPRYTYFILLTAENRSQPNLEQAHASGVDDFLQKPLDRLEIWSRLRVAERILDVFSQLTQLESLIPICAYCKKVRNEESLWEQIEQYVNQRTGSQFTHGICPSCAEMQLRAVRRSADSPAPEVNGLS